MSLGAGDASAYAGRGHVFLTERKDYDAAIADYTEAINRVDKSASKEEWQWYYSYRGRAYEKKADYDRAIADYTETIRLKGDYYIYELRGHLHLKKGNYDSAIADYTESLMREGYARLLLHVGRGQAWEAKGQPVKAIEDYTKALKMGTSEQEHVDAQALAGRRLAALQAAPTALAPQPKTPTVAPVTATPPPIRLGRRVALVIGNAAYLKSSALLNPGNDAAAVAAA